LRRRLHRRRADGSTLRESAEPVTLVATGPQTNVALLLNSHPELHAKIARIVIMGGAMVLGNWQPAASLISTSTRKRRRSSFSPASRW
jgi:inosine-uridine nucleoside N-ribohydrolase